VAKGGGGEGDVVQGKYERSFVGIYCYDAELRGGSRMGTEE